MTQILPRTFYLSIYLELTTRERERGHEVLRVEKYCFLHGFLKMFSYFSFVGMEIH